MDEKQSKRSKDGFDFELNTYNLVCEIVKGDPRVIVGRGAKTPDKAHPTLNFYTSMGIFTVDGDIVLIDSRSGVPRILISCKVSMRERASETVCAHLLLKAKYPALITFLVTEDKGDGSGKSEFGTEQSPRKPRMLLAYADITTFSTRPDTSMGSTVRPISELKEHIMKALQCA